MSLSFLDDFVKQTQTDSLKIKQYPKEYSNLLVRVSFGQGTQAKVPWVQVVSSDMPTTNGYYPRLPHVQRTKYISPCLWNRRKF